MWYFLILYGLLFFSLVEFFEVYLFFDLDDLNIFIILVVLLEDDELFDVDEGLIFLDSIYECL